MGDWISEETEIGKGKKGKRVKTRSSYKTPPRMTRNVARETPSNEVAGTRRKIPTRVTPPRAPKNKVDSVVRQMSTQESVIGVRKKLQVSKGWTSQLQVVPSTTGTPKALTRPFKPSRSSTTTFDVRFSHTSRENANKIFVTSGDEEDSGPPVCTQMELFMDFNCSFLWIYVHLFCGGL